MVPWVDGADPAWQEERRQWSGEVLVSSDNRDRRYRDWDLLRYWFRGVEKCAPWVNRIYFITNGQLPDWLNLKAEKLVHVRHSDYMPEEYLPTFSSHPIELNLHRIPDLTEHFVYFNDDFFLLRPVEPEYFFRNGLPVFASELRPIFVRPHAAVMANIHINNTRVINDRFRTKDIVSNPRNWFSPRTHSWKVVLMNLVYSRFQTCVGFRNPHYAAPMLKSTMRRLWEEEPELLDATSQHRFRDSRDVSQFIFRYWQYATNQFEAEKVQNIGKYFEIQEHNDDICKVIREQQYPQICINDEGTVTSDEGVQAVIEELSAAFDSIFPEKSQYES